MQLTPLFICLMTMAPAVIQAAPIPTGDLSLDVVLYPEGELDLVKRVTTPAKPATKPAAKPVAKPTPVPAKPPAKPAPVPAKPTPAPAKPAPAPVKPAPATAKPAPAPAKPPTTKPPPAAPVKNPPKPSATAGTSKPGLGTAPTDEDGDVCDGLDKRTIGVIPTCSCFRKCNTCTAQPGCAFSTVTFTCVDKVDGNAPADTLAGPAKGESSPRCIAVNNQAIIFKSVLIKTPGQKNRETPAGLPTADITAAFTTIQNHIFTLDNNDPKRRDSGQHLRSVWLQNHPTGPKSVANCNAATGLCSFMNGSKTVWDDSPGLYTRRDVQNMCSIALRLTKSNEGQHVVMSPLGKKICIFASKRNDKKFDAQTGEGEGSCFPVGTGEVPFPKTVNDAC